MQENEDEKLSKEEQDLAWEVYTKTLKMEDHRVILQQKISADPSALRLQQQGSVVESADDPNPVVLSEETSENDPATRATCTKLSHLLTLRSQGIKMGCSTICEECGREVSLIDLNGIE